MGKLIIDGNSVYEIDEACMKRRERRETGTDKQAPQKQRDRGEQMQRNR